MALFDIPGYDDFERIGAGASGTVFRARQLAFEDRVVAVKVIPGTDVDDRTAQRFRRECLAAGKLSWHPNVVSVYDAGITDDALAYLVMEYMEAGSLADRLRREGPLPWHRAVDTTIRVAGALGAAHATGLIHRDLKPENILIGPFGEPKLGDFGIAFIEGRSRSRTGSVSGTIAHSAPEALAGTSTEAADIYALGSTLFTLLAGTPAFVDASDHSITPLISRIAQAPVPDLRLRGVPDLLASVIERAMAKEPEDRWASASELAEALQRVQVEEGQATTPLLVARSSTNGPARAADDAARADTAEGGDLAQPAPSPTPEADAVTVVLDRQVAELPPTPERSVSSDDPPEQSGGSGRGPDVEAEPVTEGTDSSPSSARSPRRLALLAVGLGAILLVILLVVLTRGDDGRLRLDLRAGDCFDGRPDGGELVDVVSCTEPHDAVVAATVILGEVGDPYPGTAAVDRLAQRGCQDAVELETNERLTKTFPSEQGWDSGVRTGACIVSRRNGDQLPPE